MWPGLAAGDHPAQRRHAGVARARATGSDLRRGLALQQDGIPAHLLGKQEGLVWPEMALAKSFALARAMGLSDMGLRSQGCPAEGVYSSLESPGARVAA